MYHFGFQIFSGEAADISEITGHSALQGQILTVLMVYAMMAEVRAN